MVAVVVLALVGYKVKWMRRRGFLKVGSGQKSTLWNWLWFTNYLARYSQDIYSLSGIVLCLGEHT